MRLSYQVLGNIEDVWLQTSVDLDYRQCMRKFVEQFFNEFDTNEILQKTSILELPALCYQGVQDKPQVRVDKITSVWVLLYIAAHILDTVEDYRLNEPFNELLIEGYSINHIVSVSTGLIFTAEYLLANLENLGVEPFTASALRLAVNRSVLRMSSGQHNDLTLQNLTLEQGWQIAKAKSGEFFGLACYLGVRLGSADPQVLEGLTEFGIQLGIIKQIKDDLRDLWNDGAGGNDLLNQRWSLPVIYALTTLPNAEAERLSTILQDIPKEPTLARVAQEVIRQSGAAIYLGLEIKRCQSIAAHMLRKTCLPSTSTEQLFLLLNRLAQLTSNG